MSDRFWIDWIKGEWGVFDLKGGFQTITGYIKGAVLGEELIDTKEKMGWLSRLFKPTIKKKMEEK